MERRRPEQQDFLQAYTLKPDSEKSAVPESDDMTAVNDDDSDVDDEEDDIKIASSVKEEKSLLFVFQTQEQQRLLNRYGNDLCLLDATYKTTKYDIPFFFLCVKTNVKYKVVATFVIQYETTNGIAETLSVIKDWNSNWSPSYFMTDFSEEEIGAIEQAFRDSFVYICDFHREQAWERWMKQAKHGIEDGIEDRKVFLQCSVACHKLIQLKSFKLVSPTFSHHQYGTQMQDFDLGSQKRG